MAININLNNITTGFNLSKINENFQRITQAFQDALSRSGSTPNTMSADLDMNSQNVLNAGYVTAEHLIVNGYEIGQDIETRGDKGWTPYHELQPDGDRLVFQLTQYIGGEGLPPTDNIGEYLTEGGYTNDISLGTNVIGPPGPLGPGGGDLLSDNNLSDLDNKPLSFDNIKQNASTTATGVVELATDAEVVTGTDTTRATTASGVKAAIDNALSSVSAIPIGTVLDFTGGTAPAGYLFPFGQAVSRSTYSAYFAIVGTTYGAGNGSTTFNIPDLRGRAIAGKDNMGGTSANRLTGQSDGLNGDVLGASGGVETHTLTTAQIPSHLHAVDPPSTSTSSDTHRHNFDLPRGDQMFNQDIGSVGPYNTFWGTVTGGNRSDTLRTENDSHTHTVDIPSFNSGSAGSGASHNNVQPTFILNKILYVGV